jgi:glutathione S-transferase
MEAPPVLWHLKVSPYNEKARWALDHKRVPHVRRAAVPGRHEPIARRLCGGSTLPVLLLNGDAIGDSTAIVATVERRWPAPALYPADPAERSRALEVEDFFDEQLGPYVRLLMLRYLLPNPKLMMGTFAPGVRGPRALVARATFPRLRRRVTASFGIDERSVANAFAKLRVAGEAFRAELKPSGYLVGEAFSVADLTLASMVAPVVAPLEFPYPQPQRGHSALAPVREALSESGLLEWSLEIYALHRGRSAAIAG